MVIGPYNFFKKIFWYRTSFSFFQSFLGRGERGHWIPTQRERKLSLGKILTTKIIDFCVKRFHITRMINIIYFIFTLKTPKKHI
jgi:hypothetical protein